MSRAIRFMMFLTTFMLTNLLMNYYVLSRFSTFFGITTGWGFIFLVLVLSVSFPLVNILVRRFHGLFTRALYTFFVSWLGVVFIAMCVIAIFELINLFVAITSLTMGIGALIVIVLLTGIAYYNGNTLNVKEVEVDGFGTDLKMVQISDVHTGSIRDKGFLTNVAEKINILNPDVVVITGDLFDGSAPLHDDMLDPLDKINAPIFMITGNHEVYEGLDKITSVVNHTKIKLLNDETVDFKGVQFVGMSYSEDKKRLKILADINLKENAVLLYHVPQGMNYAESAGIKLMLSGHTHNGQLFPFNFVVKLVHKYAIGVHKIGNMILYVSPGTGTWGPPMRLGSKNEITLILLS